MYEISELQIKDLPALIRLYTSFIREENKWDVDLVKTRAAISAAVVPNLHQGYFLLAKKNDKPIGFLAGSAYPWPFRQHEKLGEINGLFVMKRYRHKGVGKMLITKFLDRVKEVGVHYVRVTTKAANTEIQEYYKEFGFYPVDIVYEQKL